jgi:hypothetical protein
MNSRSGVIIYRLSDIQKEMLLEILLQEKYESEFKIIDGLNQHPKFNSFEKWIKNIIDED